MYIRKEFDVHSLNGTNIQILLTSKVTSLQGLLETGQWERKRIYVLKFSQRAESEDYNESVMRQRSKDLSLADEGLKGRGNCFYESCSKTSKTRR